MFVWLARFRRAGAIAAGLAAWSLLGPLPAARAQGADPLVRAHEQYNDKRYDDAIRLAEEARKLPALADAATVVSARAHLERYRLSMEPEDLDAARAALIRLDNTRLIGRDRLDWTIGLGEVLFFDRRFNTAAEFFETALGHVDLLEPAARERLLEWWASALDQQAQLGPDVERRPLYARLLARVEDELQRDDRSPVAAYWLAAAAIGTGDLDRGWAAAEAGWLRGASAGADGVRLRGDLDRLVTTVLIPLRARALAPSGDPRPAVALLQQQWEDTKNKYARDKGGAVRAVRPRSRLS
jgi:hypothetical protein